METVRARQARGKIESTPFPSRDIPHPVVAGTTQSPEAISVAKL